MNDSSVVSEQHIAVCLHRELYTNWSVSLLDSIFIQYNTEMILASSTNNNIDKQIFWTPEVLVINHIIVSG